MSKEFSGVWGTFEFLDDMCSTITELKNLGFKQITTHAPCPRHEIDNALGNPQSHVPFFTLVGMFLGLGLAVLIMVYMTLDWIIPVSGKPVLSVPIMGPVTFELGVITSIYFTITGMLLLIIRDSKRHATPKSKKYKQYNRFMRDRFGVVISCQTSDLEKVEGVFKKYLAEEVISES